MSKALPIIFALGAYVVLPVVIIAGWVHWVRQRRSKTRLSWLSLTGFLLGTVSALLALGGMIYARSVGGFPFYDPALLRIYRWGMLLSVAGLIFGLIGLRWSSSTRWYALAASTGTLLFWLAAAAGE